MKAASMENRRRNFRYQVQTSLTFCSTTATGAALVGRGTTLDMSAGGILVELDRTLEAGAVVQLSLAWPGLYHACDYVRLDLTGKVLRSDAKRVAIQIVAHEFRVPRVARAMRAA